jgi:integrase
MLALYRRHRQNCKGNHKHNSRTSEYDERKKGWRRCECPIFVSGTLAGHFDRQNTGKWEWEDAQAAAAAFEVCGNWTGKLPAPLQQPSTPALATEKRVTIAEAVRAYLASREGTKIGPATLRKYRTFTKQLSTFAESRGYVMVDQIAAADIDVFYGNWTLGVRAKGKGLGKLRSFFRFCAKRKWVTVDITDPKSVGPVSSDLQPPIGASSIVNKIPFTDDELKRVLGACDRMQPVKWSNSLGQGLWTGEDVKDFIFVMVYTGLRISDVATFSMSRVRGNEVFLRAKKNGGDVYTIFPGWLKERLEARAARCGPRPFVVGRSDRLETVTDMWRRKINSVFELAGAFEEPPTPHRFRHTFARILLQRGVPVADVADLLGDTEETVRKHYARWVPERQARLSRILTEAFEDKPKPKVVAINHG